MNPVTQPWYKRGRLKLPGDHRQNPTLDGVVIPDVYAIDYHAEVHAVPEVVFRVHGPSAEFEGTADVLVLSARLSGAVVALLEQILQTVAIGNSPAWREAAEGVIREVLNLQALAKLGPPQDRPVEFGK